MKNILILTDFSDNATHAAEAGLLIAEKLEANLFVYHSNAGISFIPYTIYDGNQFPFDKIIKPEDICRDRLIKITRHLRDILPITDAGKFTPKISWQYGEGALGSNIQDVIAENDIELVVMGSPDENMIERIFLGSHIGTVIQNATCPVFVLPQNADAKKTDHIIFATNFSDADQFAIRCLAKFSARFNFQLEIVHIALSADEDTSIGNELILREAISGLQYNGIAYKEIAGDDVAGKLHAICKEKEGGLLAVTHHQDAVITRLFNKSITKKILSRYAIPLLVFPAGWTEKSDQEQLDPLTDKFFNADR